MNFKRIFSSRAALEATKFILFFRCFTMCVLLLVVGVATVNYSMSEAGVEERLAEEGAFEVYNIVIQTGAFMGMVLAAFFSHWVAYTGTDNLHRMVEGFLKQTRN